MVAVVVAVVAAAAARTASVEKPRASQRGTVSFVSSSCTPSLPFVYPFRTISSAKQ
jgi:hypothetical protein